ncbi:ester cyclase [Devosia beringensis]|uniref:ester cyclase n=1 Tax=Devosia beringensis TaxID=2657486 RepID=UPI001E493582|nr:ester cyclase [Devosia beringensis]
MACLNRQDWARLGSFVAEEARHNGRPFGLAGYRAMLEQDFRAIPDLQFAIDLLVIEPPHIAARLAFTCTPVGDFLGLPVNGRTVSFTENVFYGFKAGKIAEVFSIVDRQAIAAQLQG